MKTTGGRFTRRMIGKNGAVIGLFVAALVLGFGTGFLVRDWQLPPAEALKAVSIHLRQTRLVRSLGILWYHVRVRLETGIPPGAWAPVRDSTSKSTTNPLTREQRQAIDRLQSLGYLSGYKAAGSSTGVTTFVPERTFQGLNLYTSGHTPEAVLMDMQGRVLHRWHYAFRDAFPDAREIPEDRSGTGYWRRVRLYPNGDLLALYHDYGIVKLDKNSRLLWAASGRFHHDFFVGEDGRIFTLSHEVQFLDRIHPYEPLLVDSIEILDANGRPLQRVPLLEAFERSSYASLLKSAPPFGDIMHTNTVEVLDGRLEHRSPAFKKGNILVSVREMDVVAVVDASTAAVVWALSGQWHRQHDPTILDNGHILLVDNLGHGGMSKVVEIDPFTQRIVWAYESTSERPFSTLIGGLNQRLANGNTLITESDTGRAFEVTRDGRIVWEFHNEARTGDDNELVAVLFDFQRLGLEFPMSWLESSLATAHAEH